MTLRVEVARAVWIERTLEPQELVTRSLGGAEALRARRIDSEKDAQLGEETYEVAQVDRDDMEGEIFQRVVVADGQPYGSFFVGDTEIWVSFLSVINSENS